MNVHVLSWKARELAIPFDGFSITRGNNATAVDLLIFSQSSILESVDWASILYQLPFSIVGWVSTVIPFDPAANSPIPDLNRGHCVDKVIVVSRYLIKLAKPTLSWTALSLRNFIQWKQIVVRIQSWKYNSSMLLTVKIQIINARKNILYGASVQLVVSKSIGHCCGCWILV